MACVVVNLVVATDTLASFAGPRPTRRPTVALVTDRRHAVPVTGTYALCGHDPSYIWETVTWPGPEGPPALCERCAELV